MRPIKVNETKVNEIVEAIRTNLLNSKFCKETIALNFDLKTIGTDKENATVIFKEVAYRKMEALIQKCSEEVGWHGTVTKVGNTYTIEDILVFPQYVTGSTVTPDQTEYALWMGGLDNDTFNKLKFHGHSHVNMGVTPSGVDTEFQSNILNNLNSFYIFGIFNKKDANWMTIFDVEDNIIYDDKDINLICEGLETQEWADEMIKENVKKKTYATAAAVTHVNYGGYSNGYQGYSTGGKATEKKSITESIMEDVEMDANTQMIIEDYYAQLYGR